MPPQSRGGLQRPSAVPHGAQSRSTPNLPTLRTFDVERSSGSNSSSATASVRNATPQAEPASPSEEASIEDFSLESGNDPQSLSEDENEDEQGENGLAEEDEVAPKLNHLPPRPIAQRSRSHTFLSQSMFAPPFYGRPPTPLPPSPSLTSLLRPNFSSQNSRPTTPDPSSDEGGGGTPNNHTNGVATGTQTPNSTAAASTLTSSLRMAKPIPRASPRVPTYEYYGFTLYLTSSLAFVVYLLWSFLPAPFLHQLGIWYYPDRWWALAIPAWTLMFILYIYVALASYNTGYLTLPMDSVECLVDEAANVAVVDAEGKLVSEPHQARMTWEGRSADKKRGSRKGGKGKGGGRRSRQSSNAKIHPFAPEHELDWRSLWMEGTDAVMDIPIGGVCEILYGRP